MPYELIIVEKPNAAKKLADALADGKAIKENNKGVPYYLVTHGNNDIVIVSAVGHLFGLSQLEGKKWEFPVFDIEWKPSYETSKDSAFTKKYADTIKKLSKDATSYTVATDYDVEGEVIGLNVVRYICKQKDAARMKFSTLTKPDLIEAYKNKSKTLNWGQANAGETRHYMDWYNGINYSRALTSSIKTAGSFKIMSTGRVQGPALKTIVDRELEIKAFKPTPFWQIELGGTTEGKPIQAVHKEDKFWDEQKANEAYAKTKDQKQASVSAVAARKYKQAQPTPFDLTTLQVESYRCHKITPKETLSVAQELYTSGVISYPRTSSQQLTPKIGFNKILTALAGFEEYANLANQVLKFEKLEPNNGKKTDPAHPAIYPTGQQPKELSQREQKVFDLIVKRFLATFAGPATRETVTIDIDCNTEPFVAKGTRTVDKGWHEFYNPYVNIEEEELPPVQEGSAIAIEKIDLLAKETQPPKRYTQASIIKELEKRNLGTKATRSEIVETLFRRGYVDGKSIEATNLGIKTIETLEKHCPAIIDEKLTSHFEQEMDDIREGKRQSDTVLTEVKDTLGKIIEDFKKNEKDIGTALLNANIETRNELGFLGKCPKCGEGDLQMRKGKFGQFAACNKYPNCKTTFSLPSNALIKPAKKMCETCNHPMVIAVKRGKKPMEFCLNKDCVTKHVDGEAGEEAKKVAQGQIEKPCPTCKDGKVLLRSSIYGKFYGCSNYPKCKFTEKIVAEKKSEE